MGILSPVEGKEHDDAGSFVASWERDGWAFERWHCAPGPALVLPVHEHDCYQLSLTLDLPAEHRYRRQSHWSAPGTTAVFHPGEPHETRQPIAAEAVHRYVVAYVPVAAVEAVATELTGRAVREPFLAVTVIDDRAFRAGLVSLIEPLPDEPGRGTAIDDLPLEHDHRRLAAVTGALLRAGLTPDPGPETPTDTRRAAVVVDYLREHYARPVRVAELVRVAGLSERHLYRSFAALTGVPPHRYQLNLRIEHAKRLLANGSTVAAASAATGFVDQSHLTRHFKRLLGLPPGRYGARWREVVAGTSKP